MLRQIGDAECVHLATHVSWKLSAIVLSPGEVVDSQHSKTRPYFQSQGDNTAVEEDCSEVPSALLCDHVVCFLVMQAWGL